MKNFKSLKLQDKCATILLMIVGLFALIYILYGSHLSVDYYQFKKIDLDNSNGKNMVAEKFLITQTPNINIHQFGYDAEDGKMYILINDVKDIQELYFDNLSYYNYTYEEFKEKFNKPFSNFPNVNTMFFRRDYQGIKMCMKNNDKNIEITLFNCEGVLYCELSQKIDWSFIKTLKKVCK